MQSLLKNKMAFVFFLGVCCYGFPQSASGKAVNRPDLTYQEGLVSMEAYHMPLFKILEALSEKAGIDIFVSEDFEAEDISVFLVEEPIDEASKRILRHYNHAAVYAKDGEDWRLTAVKIYPKGKYGGKVVPLYSGSKVLAAAKAVGETKTVVVFSGKPMTTYGKLGKGGKLVPSRSFLKSSSSLSATFLRIYPDIFFTLASLCKYERDTFRGISGESITP